MSETKKKISEKTDKTDNEHKVLATWEYHPLVERPKKTILLAALLVLIWAVAFWLFQAWGLFMAILFTIGSLSGYVFRATYVLTDYGVRVNNPIHRQHFKWSKFVDYRDYPDAMQLYFNPRDLRGRLLKGVLMFYDGNQEQVRQIVQEYISRKKDKAQEKEDKKKE